MPPPERLKQLHVRIPVGEWKILKLLAARNGVTLQAVVTQLLVLGRRIALSEGRRDHVGTDRFWKPRHELEGWYRDSKDAAPTPDGPITST
jgi:hypothetical protein